MLAFTHQNSLHPLDQLSPSILALSLHVSLQTSCHSLYQLSLCQLSVTMLAFTHQTSLQTLAQLSLSILAFLMLGFRLAFTLYASFHTLDQPSPIRLAVTLNQLSLCQLSDQLSLSVLAYTHQASLHTLNQLSLSILAFTLHASFQTSFHFLCQPSHIRLAFTVYASFHTLDQLSLCISFLSACQLSLTVLASHTRPAFTHWTCFPLLAYILFIKLFFTLYASLHCLDYQTSYHTLDQLSFGRLDLTH